MSLDAALLDRRQRDRPTSTASSRWWPQRRQRQHAGLRRGGREPAERHLARRRPRRARGRGRAADLDTRVAGRGVSRRTAPSPALQTQQTALQQIDAAEGRDRQRRRYRQPARPVCRARSRRLQTDPSSADAAERGGRRRERRWRSRSTRSATPMGSAQAGGAGRDRERRADAQHDARHHRLAQQADHGGAGRRAEHRRSGKPARRGG